MTSSNHNHETLSWAPTLERRVASLVFNAMVRFQGVQDYPFFGRLWNSLWSSACKHLRGPVRTVIHGCTVTVNFGFSYPIVARRYATFNRPLVELVSQAAEAVKRPICLVDVGAAVGDTVLLVDANCSDKVSKYICIDGDKEFFEYLTANVGHRTDVVVVNALLSAEEGVERELVRTHLGTASAQGPATTPSVSLDAVLQHLEAPRIDVLKIDTDGFDGRVLAGASRTLQKDKPNVIFEWHPILCMQTGNDPSEAFEVLCREGYSQFIWFTKFGTFSHFTGGVDAIGLGLLTELCIGGRHEYDWHYDVVALHRDNPLPALYVAELRTSRSRPSQW